MIPKVIVSIVGSLVLAVFAGEAAASAVDLAARCKDLASQDLSRLEDAPAQITETKLVGSSGRVPAYCEVRGHVVPNLAFLLRLPSENWNGKFLQLGCGG